MVVIRLARTGSKKKPFYHIVVADKRMPRDGRYIEELGYFNPVAAGQAVKMHLDVARFDHWVGNGAQPSDRVTVLAKDFKKLATAVAA